MQLFDCRIFTKRHLQNKIFLALSDFSIPRQKKKKADQYSPESHIKVTRIKEIFFVIALNEMCRLEKGEYGY